MFARVCPLASVIVVLAPACAPADRSVELSLAVDTYAATRGMQVVQSAPDEYGSAALAGPGIAPHPIEEFTFAAQEMTLAPTTQESSQPVASPPSQPVTSAPQGLPAGYWRPTVLRQMGGESLALVKHDLWHGFKVSFWDLENILVLTATMGASITIRGTGVDDAINRRIDGNRQLGEFDEPLQILGNPGTHFAAAGALWLGSALAKNEREHEVARSLIGALSVNGIATMVLKVSANSHSPDGEGLAWPSGHTSSAFTVASVLNEYYGPWVGVPSLALAGLCGYQRLDSQTHDFSDVVFGAVLGYVVGASMAGDEKARFPEIWGMQLVPFTDPQTGTAGIALMGSF